MAWIKYRQNLVTPRSSRPFIALLLLLLRIRTGGNDAVIHFLSRTATEFTRTHRIKFGSSSTKESPVNLRVNQFSRFHVLDEHLNKFIVFVGSLVRYWNEMNERTRHFYVNRKTHKENEEEEKGTLASTSTVEKKRLSNIPLFGHVSLFMFSYCDGRVMVRQPTPKASGISFTLSLHHEIKFVFFSLRFFFSILNLALISFSNWSEISNGNGDRKCFVLLLLLLLLLG